ncbi:MAG: hypothetical protein FJ030_15780 [Chloroflexi bacterium]|nr:hypothetical protein [Chloroflexota bacterium]
MGSNYSLAFIGNALAIKGSGIPGTVLPPGDGIIPVTGAEFVSLGCGPAVITLRLRNGDEAMIDCDSGDQASAVTEPEEALPDVLPEGQQYVSAMTLQVMRGGKLLSALPVGKKAVISFIIPKGLAGRTFAIFFWDAEANDGLGAWKELQATVTGKGRVEVTVTFTGTFALGVK